MTPRTPKPPAAAGWAAHPVSPRAGDAASPASPPLPVGGLAGHHPGAPAFPCSPAGVPGPRTWTIELPAGLGLLSLNDRRHWAASYRISKSLKQAAWAMALKNKVPHLERVSIVVEYQPPNGSRRRDHDNVPPPSGKPCIDGLVAAKVITDDSREYVTDIRYHVGEPFPKGRLVLHLTEVTG